jgi:PAT family beta-lactamase induction signal transducer AmpG
MRKLSRLQGYLSTNRPLRFSVVSLLYLAQGITMGIMSIALPAYLAENGLSPKEIGLFIGTILLPWSL